MEFSKSNPQYKDEYVTNFDDVFSDANLEERHHNASSKIFNASTALGFQEPVYNFGTLVGALDGDSGIGQTLKNAIAQNHKEVNEASIMGGDRHFKQ